MSVSVHMNGRKRKDMKIGIKKHQERLNKEDGIAASKHSDSAIDYNLSDMNVNFFKDNDRFPRMREKLSIINQKRIDNGQRKLRSDANIFMTGTLQFSDESLALLGWKSDQYDDKLPADKQDEITIKRVTQAYHAAIRSIQAQPDVYGDVFSATLHFDETSPHVDFMSDPLDENDINKTARDFLNGPKGTPKGRKMREMQDKVMSKSNLKQSVIDRYDLVRGNPESKKVDKAKKLNKTEKGLSALEAKLDDRSVRLNVKEKALIQDKADFENEKQEFYNERILFEQEKELQETALRARQSALKLQADKEYQDARKKAQKEVLTSFRDVLKNLYKNTPLAERITREFNISMNRQFLGFQPVGLGGSKALEEEKNQSINEQVKRASEGLDLDL